MRNPIEELVYKHNTPQAAFKELNNVIFDATRADTSAISFEIHPQTGAVLLMDPILEVVFTLQKESADIIDMKRQDPARTGWKPREFLADETVMKRLNSFPVQASCTTILQRFNDVAVKSCGTLEVPVLTRAYQSDMLTRKAESLGFPFQKWNWRKYGDRLDDEDPTIRQRIFGRETFKHLGTYIKSEDAGFMENNTQVVNNCQAKITMMENLTTGMFKACLREQSGHYGMKSPIMGHLAELNLQFLFADNLSERLFCFNTYNGQMMTCNINLPDANGNLVIGGGSVFTNPHTQEIVYPRLRIVKVEARLHTQWALPFTRLPQEVSIFVPHFEKTYIDWKAKTNVSTYLELPRIDLDARPYAIHLYHELVMNDALLYNKPLRLYDHSAYTEGIKCRNNITRRRVHHWSRDEDFSERLMQYTLRSFPDMKELRQGYKYNQLVSLSAEDIHLRDPHANHYAVTIELKTNSESYFESASDALNTNLTVPPTIWFANEFGYASGPVVRDWSNAVFDTNFQMSIYETGQNHDNGDVPRLSFRVYDNILHDNNVTDRWYCLHHSYGQDHQKYAMFIPQTATKPAQINIYNPAIGNQYDDTLFAVLSAVTDCDLKFSERSETSYQMVQREVIEYKLTQTVVPIPALGAGETPNNRPPIPGAPIMEEIKTQVMERVAVPVTQLVLSGWTGVKWAYSYIQQAHCDDALLLWQGTFDAAVTHAYDITDITHLEDVGGDDVNIWEGRTTFAALGEQKIMTMNWGDEDGEPAYDHEYGNIEDRVYAATVDGVVIDHPRYQTLVFADGYEEEDSNFLDTGDTMYIFDGPQRQSSAPSVLYDFDIRTWVLCEMRDHFMEYTENSRTLERAM